MRSKSVVALAIGTRFMASLVIALMQPILALLLLLGPTFAMLISKAKKFAIVQFGNTVGRHVLQIVCDAVSIGRLATALGRDCALVGT